MVVIPRSKEVREPVDYWAQAKIVVGSPEAKGRIADSLRRVKRSEDSS